MKKAILHILTAIIMLTSIMGVASGCNVVEGVDSTKTQLYVANYNGGVGEIWLDNVAKRFEEAYKDVSFEDGKTGVQVVVAHDKSYNGNVLVNTIANDTNEIYFSGGVPYAEWIINGKMKDITNLVKNVRNEKDQKTIYEKLYDSDKAALAVNDKYYAIPHYSLIQGLTYDAGLFREQNLYFGTEIDSLDGTRKFVATKTSTKSCGPVGVTGTYDDGMPSSIKEFEKLIDRMTQNKIIPFTYYNSHYTNMLPSSFYVNLAGVKEIEALYSLDSGDHEVELVKDFNGDGTPNVYKEKITQENGYKVKDSSALYYAVELATKIFGNAKYNDPNAQSTTFQHINADTAFMQSGIDGKQDYIAMLIEGNYWYNEAKDDGLFKRMEDAFTEDQIARKDPRFMPLPHKYSGTVKEGEGTSPIVCDIGSCFCLVNANVEDSRMPLIEKFISFVYSDEELLNFTVDTNGVTRGVQYDYYTTYDQLSTFPQSVMDIRKAADDAGTFFKAEPNNVIVKNNIIKFGINSASELFYNGNYTTVSMAAKEGKSAKDIFNGMRISQTDWVSVYNIYG